MTIETNGMTDTMSDKWNKMSGDAKKRWNKLSDVDLDQVKGNAQQMVNLLQERYGYSRQRAEREVMQFLDKYDAKVYSVAASLPGDLPSKVMRRPWATLATMLGLGVALGFFFKPGCSDAKHTYVDIRTSNMPDLT